MSQIELCLDQKLFTNQEADPLLPFQCDPDQKVPDQYDPDQKLSLTKRPFKGTQA